MKALIIGLDGVPPNLLHRLAAAGVLPALSRLIAEGSLRDLAASIPEISSVSWTSFMTGANPGAHGIFGFTDLVPGTLKVRLPRFTDVAVPTLWDRLGTSGRRSIVINQPSTFPARPIPGVLIAGFVALDLERSVYPAKHLLKLKDLGYQIDVDLRRAREDQRGLLRDLRTSLAAREQAAVYLWNAEEWDLFQLVITETDRLQHFLWDALEEDAHPLHGEVEDYYRAVDAVVGRLVARFREEHADGAWVILSDHGFARARREVRLNAWLRQRGYLAYRSDQRDSLACLADSTRVFALDPGRLYFRGPAAESLRDEVAAALRQLAWNGQPVIRAVHRREEIYRGPLLPRAPDLVVQGLDGFDLKGTLKGEEVFAEPSMPGMHNPDAFLLADRRVLDPGVGRIDIAAVAGMIEGLYP